MRADIASLLKRSRRNLQVAQQIFEGGSYDIAVSRSYYAMFYAATAALLSIDLTFHKHSGLISAFGQHFAKPGLLPFQLHEYLLDAFNERSRGDYRLYDAVTQADALEQLQHAQEFIDAVKAFLEKESQA